MTNVNISASNEPQKPVVDPATATPLPQGSPPKPADKPSEPQK
jgi:hypothetical protein